jgi:large subunit ribosomal protein L15
MKLNDVNRGIEKHKKRRRLGRGPGSGQGKTAGRGHKGSGSRAGFSNPPAFQGGTMTLVRRVPKRGFHNKFAPTVAIVNLGTLEEVFAAGDEVTPDTLRTQGVIRTRYDFLKVLGDGALTKALKVSAHRFSQSAREKIAQAGGQVIELPGKIAVAEKQGKKPRKRNEQAAQG